MTEVQVTVLGTVCSEIRFSTTSDSGIPMARFQMRSLPRRFDRRTDTWTDGEPSYYSVVCWRRLAEHAASSLGVGDPVLATGRLRITRWRRNEETMVSAELDAQSVGHDLRWGTTVYRRGTPGATPGRVPGPGLRWRAAAGSGGTPDAVADGEGALVEAAAAHVHGGGVAGAARDAAGSASAVAGDAASALIEEAVGTARAVGEGAARAATDRVLGSAEMAGALADGAATEGAPGAGVESLLGATADGPPASGQASDASADAQGASIAA